MVQRIQSADAARRRTLWMKLAVVAVVITVIYLRPKTEDQSKPENSRPETSGKSTSESSGDPVLGQLTEVGNNVFESTAGLIYRSGSQDGHRLKHVMQHAKDNPAKKIHGVFDGDRDQILAVIDEAFQMATKGDSDVRSEQQNHRRVYTVNLRRRIGQVGGEDGKRQGNPECRYLRLVLENDNEVVSAYPTRTF